MTKNIISMDYSMSLDRVSGDWRVVGLLLMYGEGSVVCVSLCRYFSKVRVCD